MSTDLEEKREQLQSDVREFQDVISKKEDILEKAGDEISDETRQELDNLEEKAEDLQDQIERRRKVIEQKEWLRETDGEELSDKPSDRELEEKAKTEELRKTDHYRHAFVEYMQKGLQRMKPEDREVLDRGRDDEIEERATNITSQDDLGGFLVPKEFEDEITEARKQFGGMRRANTMEIETDSGGTLPFPTSDDTSNSGEYIGEDTEVSEQEVSVGEVNLEAHILSSKKVPISRALLNDSGVDMDSFLGRKLGERIGRRENTAFTSGTGSSEPHGVSTASTKALDSNSATAIEANDLIDLKHSVDPAYRENAQFMMADDTWKEVKQIKDSNNLPIFLENYRGGADSPQIDGDPVVVNNDLPTGLSTDDNAVLYGDFSRYIIRDVSGVTLLRLEEVQATKLNVVFLAFTRNDGNLIDAGGNPIQHLNIS